MILKSFKAIKVYGYLEFDIKFNADLNFLIGGNGSGKTTALRLINALCVPNFKELISTPFEYLELNVENENTKRSIICNAYTDHLELTISDIPSSLQLPKIDEDEVIANPAIKDLDDYLETLNRKFADHAVVKEIASISSPIFLGLDRKWDNREREAQDFFYERNRWAHETSKRAQQSRRLHTSSSGISLTETEFLVQSAYRRLREIEDNQANKLKSSVLLSTFKYTEFNSNLLDQKDDWKQRGQLLERKKEIQDALSKIDSKDSRLSAEVDTFFDRLTTLFDDLQRKQDDGGISIEWLINKAQIDRIARILEVIDDHKSRMDVLYKPISKFLEVINGFFIESYKELQIDKVGRISIRRPNSKTCSIDCLSSGERQLLVIFSHAFFHKYSSKSTEVFIIDEPELSLHLVWQEKFVPTLNEINPSIQYILATHSPEIIGLNKRKTIKCR